MCVNCLDMADLEPLSDQNRPGLKLCDSRRAKIKVLKRRPVYQNDTLGMCSVGVLWSTLKLNIRNRANAPLWKFKPRDENPEFRRPSKSRSTDLTVQRVIQHFSKLLNAIEFLH